MVFFLSRDVLPDRISGRCANGESRITVLPGETSQTNIFMDPNRRRLFQFTHHVREAMGRSQAEEKMNVVAYSTHALGKSVQAAKSTAKVIVQARAPF